MRLELSNSRSRASIPRPGVSTQPVDPLDPDYEFEQPFDGLPYPPRLTNLSDSSSDGTHLSFEEEGSELSTRPRRRRPPPEWEPDPRQDMLINQLSSELLAETAGRDRFADFSELDLRQAATTLVRYRLSSLATIRHTERDARRLFLSELRENERKSFPEMQLLMQIFSHFAPVVVRQRLNAKDPSFEELVIPQKLAQYTADLKGLGGFLKPNQPMVNHISKELAVGKLKVPSYTPYIVPNLAEAPWPVPSAEHRTALSKWGSNRQAARSANPQALPLNAWILYQLRFIFAADLCGAWSTFGGISAQLNRLSVVLHIATTESIGTALTYDQLLKSHLEELARARANGTAGAVDFAALLSTEQHCFKLQAVHQHAKPVKDPVVKKEKEKEKKEKKKDWLPKHEFLKKLAEDRRQNAANATSSDAKPGRSRSRSRSHRRNRSKRNDRKKSPAREPMKQRKRR